MSLTLPPLPDFGGETTGRNVVDVVAGEHRTITALLAELTDGTVEPSRRRMLAEVVAATLSRHLSAEQQYLYPAVRAVVPDGESLADREVAEDHALLVTLQQLAGTGPDGPDFDRLADGVAVQVRRHIDASAAELVPLLQQMAPIEDLIRLGNRMETAEEAAPTRPHPATPATPPWNKVVDPAVGVIDRVRDAMSRRTTYAKDL